MVDFLTRKNTAFQVEEIVKKAEKELILISPYLQLSEDLVARLKDRDKHPVDITIIYRDDEELKPNQKQRLEHEIQKLQQLKHLSLARLKHLHAKCFFNEESMVITSMNMYEFSEKTNREMGVLIRAKDDEKVYGEAVKEAQSIVHLATKDELKRPKSRSYSYKPRTKQPGYCIRCKRKIPYNLDYPLCNECFEVWAQYGDLDYPEHYCHTCGKRASTSKGRPECNSCYKPQK